MTYCHRITLKRLRQRESDANEASSMAIILSRILIILTIVNQISWTILQLKIVNFCKKTF